MQFSQHVRTKLIGILSGSSFPFFFHRKFSVNHRVDRSTIRLFFLFPIQIRVSQNSPNSKIHHHRRYEVKIPPATGPIKRKMNETLECLNSKAELWRIKRERVRERENSSTWSLRPKFSFHVRFWPIVAAMHLPNVSPPPAAKIVEHEYLAFGRKISPWTCTINDPPLFLLNRWIRTLSSSFH